MAEEYIYAENEHPGIILQEEFLEPLGISQNQLAIAMGVPRNRISQIIRGKRAITAETSMRLGRALGMGDFFFLNLQIHFEKLQARRELEGKLADVQPILTPKPDASRMTRIDSLHGRPGNPGPDAVAASQGDPDGLPDDGGAKGKKTPRQDLHRKDLPGL